ncbi:MAG: hypothetical protein GVY13_04500 [Alphaproteobacteria bacterium]|nr:hypothetical protein [Alphaproteobacteria bacterium]
MADLIGTLTSSLGVTEAQAVGGAGAIFGLAQQRLSPDEFATVSESMPGVEDLIAAAPSAATATEVGDDTPEQGGGMPGTGDAMPDMGDGMPGTGDAMPGMGDGMPDMGDAMPDTDAAMAGAEDMAGDLMGEATGAAGLGSLQSLAGPFQSLGMSPEMAGEFLPIILDYAGGNGGPQVMSLLQGALLGG